MPEVKADIEVAESGELVKEQSQQKVQSAKKNVARRTKSVVSSEKPAKTVKSVTTSSSVKPIDVNDPIYYLNREINWIDFDRKVLEQAKDALVPILERLKFLSIFYNNLDEFFMVRVANVWKQVQSGAEPTGADKLAPRRQFSEIGRRVREVCEEAEELGLDKYHYRKKHQELDVFSLTNLNT